MEEKVIIITGASRGIGRNIAETLACEGNKIIANYNKSEEDAKKLKDFNTNIDIFKADVSKKEECIKLVNYVISKYGRIDVLINNAGIDLVKMFTDITEDDWNNIINTNLYSAFCMSQETVKHMIKQNSGSIINISSIWGITGGSMEVLYSISKAGLDGMTKALAKELGPSNIRVNSIAPGTIITDMDNHLSNEEWKEVLEEIPLGKRGNPIDVTRCVKWLIEDEYTTGQVISPNGGWVI